MIHPRGSRQKNGIPTELHPRGSKKAKNKETKKKLESTKKMETPEPKPSNTTHEGAAWETKEVIPQPFKKESKPSKDTDLWQSSTRAADDLAREALASLQRGQRPSDQVVLKALRLWGFDKNKSRQNVIPNGRDWVQCQRRLEIMNPCSVRHGM